MVYLWNILYYYAIFLLCSMFKIGFFKNWISFSFVILRVRLGLSRFRVSYVCRFGVRCFGWKCRWVFRVGLSSGWLFGWILGGRELGFEESGDAGAVGRITEEVSVQNGQSVPIYFSYKHHLILIMHQRNLSKSDNSIY